MKRYHALLFDLDGTLTDPKEGITNSIRYALVRLDIEESEPEGLVDFIGPPLLLSFRKRYRLSDARARQAIAYYREYFATRGIFENRMYDGITTLISELSLRPCLLVVATSKPTIYAEEILRHFGLYQYFDLVVGSNMDLTRASKIEIIAEVLRVMPDSKESGIIIGDRADDIMAAKAYLMDSVAVSYGYGSEVELSATEPTYTIQTVGELSTLLLSFTRS